MSELDVLAQREQQLLDEVTSWEGSIDQLIARLRESGIAEDYSRIHQEYVSLALSGSIEAAKRALFLQWYSATEPACFTGLLKLDAAACSKLLKGIRSLLEDGDADAELAAMLEWYGHIGDRYFETRQDRALVLRARVKATSLPQADDSPTWAGPSFPSGRGQMSTYFRSLTRQK